MVKKSVLERFIKLGGYDIVKPKDGRWKNVSLASKKTGLSRMTISRLLSEYPEEPRKGLPKYVKELRASEGFKKFKQEYGRKVNFNTWRTQIEKMFMKLNKKDPISWGEKDFRIIWETPEFLREEAGGFAEHYATCFHNLMRAIGRHDLLAKFKGHKMVQGKKRHWFLHDEDIIRMVACCEDKETLMFIYSGIVWGARASAMLGLTISEIDFKDNTIQVYESKRKQFVSKYPPLPLMKLLKKYTEGKKPEEKVFPSGYGFINTSLSKAAKCGGIKKSVSTHILKHTFVSQGYRHMLSRETVVEMTGTEDRTIRMYYLALDEKRIRHEMQGLQLDAIPFAEWVQSLAPYFEQKYVELGHL